MPSPSLPSLTQRLTTVSSLILERSRVVSLSLPPSASTENQILRGLTFVRDGLSKLEDEIELESSGLSVGKHRSSVGGLEKEIGELGERYDRLMAVMEEDDIGRSKVKGLKRVVRARTPSPEPPSAAQPFSLGDEDDDATPYEPPFRDDPSPSNPLQPNGRSHGAYDPDLDGYGGSEAEEDPMSEQQMLRQQEQMMEDQDSRLSLLSHSLNKQSHISLQINSELEVQHELLEETDQAMDRTQARMAGARKRLDKVARGAKDYGSTITIVVLIFILLILIIAFKT